MTTTPAQPINENDERKLKVADQVVSEVLRTGAVVFRDQFNGAYLAYEGDGTSVFKLNSEGAKLWIARLVWENLDKTIGSDVMQTVIQILKAQAFFGENVQELSVRVATYEHSLWYDLGRGRVVQTYKGNWLVLDSQPIIFRHFQHQRPQITPTEGGSLDTLFNFINISNEDDRLLLLVFLVSSLIPGFSHPILALFGLQGSAKSTVSKLLKSLIDPSALSTISAPTNEKEFIQTAAHHWLLPLDNLSGMPIWLSDALCRISTGQGFSKRELYSDDDDIIYSFQHVAIVNGINQIISKPDLLDRLIILELERVPDHKRMEEAQLWKEFHKAKPVILGAIFDTLSKALAEYETVKLDYLPRMADFARWGCAIAQALGKSSEDFLRAYERNINHQHDEALAASPVAEAIQEFMKNYDEWSGTPAQLFKQLIEITEHLEIDRKSSLWPKDPSRLGKRIREVQVNLKSVGISFHSTKSGERLYTLRKDQKVSAHSVQIPVTDVDGKDGMDTISFNPEEIVTEGGVTLGDIDEMFGIESVRDVPSDELPNQSSFPLKEES